MKERFLQAKKLIEMANRVLCISHKNPDGDTLGSAIAIYYAIKDVNRGVDIACVDDVPRKYSFLPGINRMIKSFEYKSYDLIIVLDAGASYMTNYHDIYPGIWSGEVPVLNIDHHSSNDNFGTCNIIDIEAASTTIILYRLFVFLGVKITPLIATALLTGIYNDTGSFMHSNTSSEVFEVSSHLISCGGKLTSVSKNLFKSTRLSTLKLWGRVLENTKMNRDGVIISIITWRDFEECHALPDEISGIVDLLNSVPGSKYTCLLNEDRKGYIKGSFRTRRDDVDVSELASKFGGGGHKKAAGFTIAGKLQKELYWKIINT